MRVLWRRAVESFWFFPAVLSLVAVALAEVLVRVERGLAPGAVESVALLSGLGASGSRALLGAIATSVLTVTGTTFSITISVLATTTSSYGPRLVRNFMTDRGNQLVLAVFTASFLYSLVVLRSVRSETDDGAAFVPTIAVNGAMLLAVLCVGVLVYFIHHIADSVQVSTLQRRVRDDLDAVVELLVPDDPPDGTVGPPQTAADRLPPEHGVVRSPSTGYVQWVDVEALVHAAERADGLAEAVVGPGDHVVAGDPVLTLRGPAAWSDDAADQARRTVVVGDERTPHQDLAFAAQQLTEMAVRALSPGTNDPYTAASAFDALGDGLVRLAGRDPARPGAVGGDGELRAVVRWPTAEEVVSEVLVAVRTYALGSPVALRSAVRLVERLERASRRPPVRESLRAEVTVLREAVATSALPEHDRTPVVRRLDVVLAALAPA
ncbi:DUF2254 domain-containing protein [Cellulosimicrobium marinum]|uniref:DUF2254 domain-containing protein n=1 Tax=Cellulosimicrobium marinum TaxID=1638992 RepID=UPI001E45709F|nr:DUF2254 domain-containing protein [Cellulosimicrobium marinum]MCB7136653.1 DUF2254 domain-containing protein [Cellulosimicrobium marinum]